MLYKYIIKINTSDKVKLDGQLERIKMAHRREGVGVHKFDFDVEFAEFKMMLNEVFSRMEEVQGDERLFKMAPEVLKELELVLEDDVGCDHSIGLCSCNLKRIVRLLRDAINNTYTCFVCEEISKISYNKIQHKRECPDLIPF